MAAWVDLAGGESRGAWATGQNGATTWKTPWVAGLEGCKTEVGGRRGEAGAGVGAATPVRRRCWRLIPVRERANTCAARARAVRSRKVATSGCRGWP
jgi:hypothetical protein